MIIVLNKTQRMIVPEGTSHRVIRAGDKAEVTPAQYQFLSVVYSGVECLGSTQVIIHTPTAKIEKVCAKKHKKSK